MSSQFTRRRFMQAGMAVGGWALAAPGRLLRPSVNDKLNIAVIGCGGRGYGLVKGAKDENIVALCDVDDNRAKRAFKDYPDVPKYRDFRVLLDKEKGLDAVMVGTPDHMHAPIAIAAMKRGLHCYCEKPLTWSVSEARRMTEVAAEMKVATQMGNQGSAANGFRRGVELLNAGILGTVREVHVWTNRPVWPQAIERPAETKKVPDTLSWDHWLGVAPERPYHDAYLPFDWRGWCDFGTGALGDMACHTWNLAWRGLKLGAPDTVEAETTKSFKESYPAGAKVHYEFGANGDRAPLSLTWYEGKTRPHTSVLPNALIGKKQPRSGLLIVADQGMMFSRDDYGARQTWYPAEAIKFETPEVIPRSVGHIKEWIVAAKGGPRSYSDFSQAGPFTETVLLGNLAMRTGKKIEWDAERMEAKGVPEANALIRREYREGYGI